MSKYWTWRRFSGFLGRGRGSGVAWSSEADGNQTNTTWEKKGRRVQHLPSSCGTKPLIDAQTRPMSSSATPQPPQQGHHPTTSTEYRIPSPPQHPISSIVFHPQPTSSEAGRRLLVSSWDSTVRLYQLPDASTDDGNVKAAGVRELHSFKHEAPVLDVCWISDELAASGGIDRRLRL